MRKWLTSVARLMIAATPQAALAKSQPPPSALFIETQLCPVGGTEAYLAGTPRSEVKERTAAIAAPFKSSTNYYSAWSERLAAVELNGEVPVGPKSRDFISALKLELAAHGWKQEEGYSLHGAIMSEGEAYSKPLPVQGKMRDMVVQFQANGWAMLRCGDKEFLELDEAEKAEDLQPGSERPVAPQAPAAPSTNLLLADCSDTKRSEEIVGIRDERGARRLAQAMDHAFDMRDYAARLHTWLRWKIISSGKIDGAHLQDIESSFEEPMELSNEQSTDIETLSSTITAINIAQIQGDATSQCRALANLLALETKSAESEYLRLSTLNRGLEEEALRLGVAVQ